MSVFQQNVRGTKFLSIDRSQITTSGTISTLTPTTSYVQLTAATQVSAIATSGFTTGTELVITNSNSVSCTFVNGSSLITGTGANVSLPTGGSLYLKYNDAVTGWQVVNAPSTTLDLTDPKAAQNYSITATVAANALTIALKDAAGSDPSSTSPARFAFRSATLATGTYSYVSATAATSLVISSGSTLGQINATAEPIYVYLINNAGTLELAASTSFFSENNTVSTTAEGGAGAADDRYTMYSTTARSNVSFRLIGKITSTQATAGTWASSPSIISLQPLNDTGARTVAGNISGTTVPVGYIGEEAIQQRLVSSPVSLTTSIVSNVTATALTLTPGIWDICGSVYYIGTSTAVTRFISSISDTSATNGSPNAALVDLGISYNLSLADFTQVLPTFRLALSSSTTYYLTARATFGSGTATAAGRIRAVRVG